MDLSTFVQGLRANADDGPGTVDALHQVEPRPARMQAFPDWLHPCLHDALHARGIVELFYHQRECADLLHDRKHAVIARAARKVAIISPMQPGRCHQGDTPFGQGWARHPRLG